ncbi:MAG: ABC transporter ATP-binding protein [Pseudoclavibacter sp.]
MTDVLRITDLVVGYGDHIVLDGVSLRVPRGGSLGLVGESGSGKSTLARAVLGVRSPRSGTIAIEPDAPGASGAVGAPDAHIASQRPVQMVFQDPISSLNPTRKAIDLVAEPLTIRGEGTTRSRRAAARELLDRVGLDPNRFADAKSGTLSGGQAQRVAIARALLAEPALLICDEPVSSLDVSVQARVLNLLADLRDETGLSMLFISHDLAVVRMISDEVAVLKDGRIVEFGETESVIAAPKHDYTRELIDAAPRLPIPQEAP